jgi:hypothetical protein
MSNLRSQIIRLASSLPKGDVTRRGLLAALMGKEARDPDWKTLLSGDKVRIRWADHPDNEVLIEEMPGKPVKKRVRRMAFRSGWYVQAIYGITGSNFLMENILKGVNFNPGMSYDQAVAVMRDGMEKAKQDTIEGRFGNKVYPDEAAAVSGHDEAWFAKTGWGRSSEDLVNFLEVEPANYKPISLRGKDFYISSTWQDFTFSDDRDEDEWMAQVEGMRAFYKSKSAGGARKVFKLLQAAPDAVKGMTAEQFRALLSKNGIAYEYVPTVWR